MRQLRAVVLGLALMSGTAERASAAPITGRVFHDYNTNGRFDTDAAKGAVDTPVGGMLVRVFTGNDTEVARATTAADGTYSVTAPNARVRVALSVPCRGGRRGSSTGCAPTSISWTRPRRLRRRLRRAPAARVDGRQPVRVLAAAVGRPALGAGGQQGRDPRDAVLHDAARELRSPFTTFAAQPETIVPAKFSQLGSVYGLGLDQRTGNLYAGAYYKRYSGLTSHGPGAIFRVTPAATCRRGPRCRRATTSTRRRPRARAGSAPRPTAATCRRNAADRADPGHPLALCRSRSPARRGTRPTCVRWSTACGSWATSGAATGSASRSTRCAPRRASRSGLGAGTQHDRGERRTPGAGIVVLDSPDSAAHDNTVRPNQLARNGVAIVEPGTKWHPLPSPPQVDYRKVPLPGPQPNMPAAATAPARPATGRPEAEK